MLHSTDYRELRDGKRYQTSIERIMSNHGSTEEIADRSSSKNVEGEIPEVETLKLESVNQQIRRFYRSSNSPARGVDSAGMGNNYLKASKFLTQD